MFDFPNNPAAGTPVTLPDGAVRTWDGQKWKAGQGTAPTAGGSFLPLAGGVMVGALSLAGNATSALHAVPLQQLNAATAGGPFLPLTPSPVTATGSTTSRSLQDRAAEVVNVKDYGAKGDGVTDDTAAINAALNYIRAHLGPNTSDGYHSPFRLVFPAGRYVVTASLNFTGFASIPGGVIDGQGSEIWAKMSGGIVIDCTGSRFLRFHDLTIYGDPTQSPAIGIQIAKVVNGSAGDHTMMSVNVWGNFSFTALYNCGSESCGFYDCAFRNSATGTNRFCAVLDGLNHWNTQSSFVAVTNPVETPSSFQQCVFVNGLFQGQGANGVIWLSNTQRHAIRSSYASNQTAGSNIFTIYQPNWAGGALDFVELDVHIETTAVANMVVVTAPAGKTAAQIYNLTIADDACQATAAVFAIDPASPLTAVELRDATINVWSGTAQLVDTPAKWIIRAKQAAVYSTSVFNSPATWTGPISFATQPALSYRTLDKWTSAARPVAPGGSIGFATDTNRFDFYDGTAWQNYVKLGGDTMTGGLTVNGSSTFSAATTFSAAGNGLLVSNNAYVGNQLTVNAGNATFGAGALAGNVTVAMQSAAGFNRLISVLSGSGGAAGRWLVGANGTAEVGFNAGSDFIIIRQNDSGGIVDTPVTITRSTGNVTLRNSIGVWNTTPPTSKPAFTGAKGSNAALASVIAVLVSYGIGTDSTTA